MRSTGCSGPVACLPQDSWQEWGSCTWDPATSLSCGVHYTSSAYTYTAFGGAKASVYQEVQTVTVACVDLDTVPELLVIVCATETASGHKKEVSE